jgi:phage terminase small subunit
MPRPGPSAYVRPIPTALPQRLKPPEGLSEGAKAEFLRVVACEKPTHFTPSDLSLLVQYCEATALAGRAIREMQGKDPPDRWLSTWSTAVTMMKNLATKLRLSPQSRQANNPTRPQKLSYYERAKLEEGDSDAE